MAVFGDQKRTPKEKTTSLFNERDIERKRNNKSKQVKANPSFAEISPTADLTENGFFELSDDAGFMEILQITSKDVYSLNKEDAEKDIVQFAYFNQWYVNDYKIVPLNFPEDTSKQQRHLLKKLNNPVKQEHVPFLQQKLEELKFIESDRTNREYFMFLYAEDEYTLLTRVKQVQGLLQNVFPVIQLSDEKKINIHYKLFNLNSKNRTSGSES